LAQDRAKDAAASLEAELASSLEVKEARANKAVIADLADEGSTPQADSMMPMKPQPSTPDRIVVAAHERKRPGK
jgi:hypothetical protein